MVTLGLGWRLLVREWPLLIHLVPTLTPPLRDHPRTTLDSGRGGRDQYAP